MKVVFDTETTGLNPCENEIAQLSYIMVDDNYEIKSKNGELTYLTVSIPCILKVEGEI